jgi:hypothetical protein
MVGLNNVISVLKSKGIIIEKPLETVNRWIWQRVVQQGANSMVIHFLTERTVNKMSEEEISKHGNGWEKDNDTLSVDIKE